MFQIVSNTAPLRGTTCELSRRYSLCPSLIQDDRIDWEKEAGKCRMIGSENVYSRAWCFQETLLARRCLGMLQRVKIYRMVIHASRGGQRHIFSRTFSQKLLTAGVASFIANTHRDRYLAGIWEGDLHLGLMWAVHDRPSSAPSCYLGPTFSWVSANRPISFYTTWVPATWLRDLT